MSIKKITFLSLSLLVSVAFQPVLSQRLDTIPLNNPLPVLNGKAIFTFPKGAKNIQRTADIMSADYNQNEETRIILDIQNMRLVFFAEELFALGEDHLLENVSKDYGKDPFLIKTLTDKDQLYSILATPTQWDSTQNGILLNTLIVQTPDNTLFRIHALISPAAYKLKDEFKKLSEQVFSSLVKGNRAVDLSPRKESITIFGTEKQFNFHIPQNYVINVSQKYDFQVFKFRKYRPYSDTSWTSITIYTGHHPSANYRDYGFAEKDLQKIDGFFLGKKVPWIFFHIPEEQYYCKEQVIPSDEIEKDLIVHAAMSANQQALLDELTPIVENITLSKK